jgi:hypothetical protein
MNSRIIWARVHTARNGGLFGIRADINTLTRESNETHYENYGKGFTPAQYVGKVAKERRETALFWTTCYLLLILVSATVTIPLHYILQTKPGTTTVADSAGPWMEVNIGEETNVTEISAGDYLSANGTDSWSDCFELKLVSNRYGFFVAWWEDPRAEPAKPLAIL